MALNPSTYQQCISSSCGATFDVSQPLTSCKNCGNLLDIAYEWDKLPVPKKLPEIGLDSNRLTPPASRSGVWKFHSLLPFADAASVVSVGEGQTILQQSDSLARQLGLRPGRLFLQYEGLNPSGSFKDNGMTAAFTHARAIGARRAACASTGNTSASLALFAAVTGLLKAIIFVGSGKIALGKLSQALDYGALTLQIDGDFDDAMAQVRDVSSQLGIYLVNSVNPFRLEGQKSIILRVLEELQWEVPEWIVVPGGNLGNSSAFGKVLAELKLLGLIDHLPRLAIINSDGASTLDRIFNEQGLRWNEGQLDLNSVRDQLCSIATSGAAAQTVASAIEINLPVNLGKCLRALEVCDGLVRSVSDTEILDHKALVGQHGFGCEPASGASVAGVRLLRGEGVISPDDRVVCILTGHALKDANVTVGYHTDEVWRTKNKIGSPAYANRPIPVANDIDSIVQAIEQHD